MATGSAVSPHVAAKLFTGERAVEQAVASGVGLLSGEIATPSPTQSIDLSTATPEEVKAHLDAITLYQQLDGRPAIFVYDPAAGHYVYLYTDVFGGSHFKGASA